MEFGSIVTRCTAAVLLLSIFVILKNILQNYHKHEIGVAVTTEKSLTGVDFPAISICSWHFDFQRLRDDLGFPQNPLSPQKYSWRHNPAIAYEYVDLGLLNMSHFLHTYYIMPNQLFVNSKAQNLKNIFGCKVSNVLCEVFTHDLTYWSDEVDIAKEIHVSKYTQLQMAWKTTLNDAECSCIVQCLTFC